MHVDIFYKPTKCIPSTQKQNMVKVFRKFKGGAGEADCHTHMKNLSELSWAQVYGNESSSKLPPL